jgi:hypothetical protein
MSGQQRNMSQPKSGQLLAVLLGSIALTVALFYIPYGDVLARPLLLFSTFAHEMGHGIAAELVGGDFHKFVMWADGSGMAMSSVPSNRFDHAITALGGLIGPAILSMILFAVSTKPKWSKGAMMVFGGICVLSVILVVRNPFGIVFVSAFAAIFLAIGYFASVPIAHFALVFVAVQLALSVFSRSDYLFTDTAQTAQGVAPSDVGQIADALLLPYWFWGALIALLSVAILGFGCWIYFRAYNGMKSNGS